MEDLSRRPVELAVEVAAARAVVVGSTARLLREGTGRPRDLDLAAGDADLPCLVTALARVGGVLEPARLRRTGLVRVDTDLGPVDVFAGLRGGWRPLAVSGVVLRVAT